MVTQGVRLFYRYSGGMPPPSAEELTIRQDGMAQYLAAHPWPKQPPFDEIGLYRRALAAKEWGPLESMLEAIFGRGLQVPEALRYADSGVEALRVTLNRVEHAARWSAADVPRELTPVVAALRSLISDLREHPRSVLHAELALSVPGQAPDVARLELQSRGAEPFVFYGFGAREGCRPEIRLRTRTVDETSEVDWVSPIPLLRAQPVAVRATRGQPSISADRVVLPPGRPLSVQVPLGEYSGFQSARQGNLVLDSLVRICFQRVTRESETVEEEGWIIPEPVPIDLAPAGAGSAGGVE